MRRGGAGGRERVASGGRVQEFETKESGTKRLGGKKRRGCVAADGGHALGDTARRRRRLGGTGVRAAAAKLRTIVARRHLLPTCAAAAAAASASWLLANGVRRPPGRTRGRRGASLAHSRDHCRRCPASRTPSCGPPEALAARANTPTLANVVEIRPRPRRAATGHPRRDSSGLSAPGSWFCATAMTSGSVLVSSALGVELSI